MCGWVGMCVGVESTDTCTGVYCTCAIQSIDFPFVVLRQGLSLIWKLVPPARLAGHGVAGYYSPHVSMPDICLATGIPFKIYCMCLLHHLF